MRYRFDKTLYQAHLRGLKGPVIGQFYCNYTGLEYTREKVMDDTLREQTEVLVSYRSLNRAPYKGG